MDADSLFATILQTANEILTSAIVVIAFSLLLYNLTRNLRNRVARASGLVLACVTLPYVCDSFLSLNPIPPVYEAALRLQWIGIAYVPAALFHLSDALLATTGLPSRGRRRRVSALLYLISTVFFITAASTNLLIDPVRMGLRYSIRGGELFWLYLLYFLIITVAVFINLQRARRRCLTRSTARRMAYLQLAILTPALGVFPFSALLDPGTEFSILALLLVNIANVVVIVMLIFLSYPMSFFGSNTPDRVVKTDLLRFLLRGPGTGLLALATIILTADATRIMGLPGEDFMPFAVVTVVLLWQWTIALGMPWLEKILIYGRETEEEEGTRLLALTERIQTRSDLEQHLEATLSACCDLLRTEVAYVLALRDSNLEMIQQVGMPHLLPETLTERKDDFLNFLAPITAGTDRPTYTWEGAPVFPLFSRRISSDPSARRMPIGLLIIETTPNHLRLEDEENDLLRQYLVRVEQTLDDLALRTEILALLEGLLPQIQEIGRGDVYRPSRQTKTLLHLPDKEEMQEQVRAALRDYWGGPGMTKSRLMELEVVQSAMQTNDNPINALRSVLQEAVESLRPGSERAMNSPEWTQYNIVELRFLEGRTVRDVARRMNISEADLYRKQRHAIETITDTLLRMEATLQQRQIS